MLKLEYSLRKSSQNAIHTIRIARGEEWRAEATPLLVKSAEVSLNPQPVTGIIQLTGLQGQALVFITLGELSHQLSLAPPHRENLQAVTFRGKPIRGSV